jgi:hypothetical protein
MTVILVGLLAVCVTAEQNGHTLVKQGVDHTATALQPGGKHGGQGGALRHRELRPLGDRDDRRIERLGSTPCTTRSRRSAASSDVDDQLGEVIYCGVGSGLYGMLVFAIIAVFVAGLMVGRTPEYLGKKIEGLRDEDGVAGHPHPARGYVLIVTGRRRAHARRQGRPRQSRRPRLQRDPLRVLLGRQQQRQRLRGLSANTPFY